jgi:hypothetical protein
MVGVIHKYIYNRYQLALNMDDITTSTMVKEGATRPSTDKVTVNTMRERERERVRERAQEGRTRSI